LRGGGGATRSPRCCWRWEPRSVLDVAGQWFRVPAARSPGWGREEAGAAASLTVRVRARARGGSGGRRPSEGRRELKPKFGVLLWVGSSRELGGGRRGLRGPPGQLGLPAGHGRDRGARRGPAAGWGWGLLPGLHPLPAAGRSRQLDRVPRGLSPGTR
jgi:hypothetical protein